MPLFMHTGSGSVTEQDYFPLFCRIPYCIIVHLCNDCLSFEELCPNHQRDDGEDQEVEDIPEQTQRGSGS